jgi:hypothetical protein
MARDEDQFEDAPDPGDPPVGTTPTEEPEEAPEGEFPDAQILVDEETGQHYIAFPVEPPEEEEENGEEGGEAK